MTPEISQALKEVLIRIHDNSAHALNRTAALETMLRRHPDLWKEYREALDSVEGQAVHRDFDTLLDRIR